MLSSFFEYGFVWRGLIAGIIIAVTAPLIGIFLVLRRYSLIADTLAHVSLSGLALGLLLKINPLLSALAVTLVSALGIERLRTTKKVYGESALAIFLSGSLATAIVILSYTKTNNTHLLHYLFGSIVTVTNQDIITIGVLALVVMTLVLVFYKELVFSTFNEEAARVRGVPTKMTNTILILLAALTIALSISMVGVLLISALIVLPVVTALQLRTSFAKTILWAEIISLVSMIVGIFLSFYLNTSTGGTIVLVILSVFLIILFGKNRF